MAAFGLLSRAGIWSDWVRLRPVRPQNTSGPHSSDATSPGRRASVMIIRWPGTCPCLRRSVHSARRPYHARSALPSELYRSPAEGKGGGRGSKSGRNGSRPSRADPNLERREPPGATQVTRGPWRSNPPSESQSRCIWLETYHSALPASDRGGWSRAAFPG